MRCQAPCGEVNSGLHICISQAGLLQQVMQIKPGPEHAGSLHQTWEKMKVVLVDILSQISLTLTDKMEEEELKEENRKGC